MSYRGKEPERGSPIKKIEAFLRKRPQKIWGSNMEEIRQLLLENGQKQFDDIVSQRVLGASRHIHMIGDMFLDLTEKAEGENMEPGRLMEKITQVADYFKRTRGEASCAVTNAVNEMLAGMKGIEHKAEKEAVRIVRQAVFAYRKKLEDDIRIVVDCGAQLAKDMKKILVFDYSSTVNAFLERLDHPETEVYIPESRSINGGAAFARTAVGKGMKVHFIPDSAMMYFLRDCEAAFCGAESLFPDGTAFNTTGSEIVGLICKELRIPFYILTPMVKLDIRGIYGYQRKTVINDLRQRFTSVGLTEEEMKRIDFKCPELLPIDRSYITGFITEMGIIPTESLYEQALIYHRKLEGGRAYV